MVGSIGRVGRMIGRVGASSPSTGGVLNAFSAIKSLLAADAGDVNGVVCGDSLGNSTDEWIYLLFVALSALYPAYTFEYYAPNGTGGYNAVTTLTTGTGPNTFRLYNNSNAGSRPHYLMGFRYEGAFLTPGHSWDFVLWNHGKNCVVGLLQLATQSMFVEAIAKVQLDFPTARHIVTNQYRNRDNTDMDRADISWRSVVADDPTITIIDQFNDVTLVSDDFTDSQHATAACNSGKLLPHALGLWNAARAGTFSAGTPWLLQTAQNMLDGDGGQQYANFALDGNGTNPGAANTIPADYNVAATITFSQDTVRTYGGAARSQKMLPTAGAASRIFRNPSAGKLAAIKGNRVCAALINYAETGGNANLGRLQVTPNGTGAAGYASQGNADYLGAWVVRVVIVDIPSDATNCPVSFYHDSTSPADTVKAVNLQWATMAIGSLPRASSA